MNYQSSDWKDKDINCNDEYRERVSLAITNATQLYKTQIIDLNEEKLIAQQNKL